jgi:hypothetical protein
VAIVEVTIVHNAYDSDVDAVIEIAGEEGAPAAELPLGGTSAAVASDWVTGASTLGNVEWTFQVPAPAALAAFLPPSNSQPWRLRVTEGGFLNRSGRVTDFRVMDLAPGGKTHVGGPTPRQTLEGQTWWISTPVPTSDAGAGIADGAWRYGPNPVHPGQRITFIAPLDPGRDLTVHDLAGRRLACATFVRAGDVFRAEWPVRDDHGRDLPPGLYFARAGAGPTFRIAVLDR